MNKIVIKPNNTCIKEPCVICNQGMKNTAPLGIFFEGTWDSVCIECAEEHSPEIVRAIHSYYEDVQKTEMEILNKKHM